MSYARLGCDGSDVYLYCPDGVPDDEWWIVCSGCRFLGYPSSDKEDVLLKSQEDALKHLGRHLSAGHVVPASVFVRMKNEAAESGTMWP